MKLIKCLCGKVPLVHHVKMLEVPSYHKYRIECECGLNNFHVYDSEELAIAVLGIGILFGLGLGFMD